MATMAPHVADGSAWRHYNNSGCWSLPLQRLMLPILLGALGAEGGGNPALPALRDAISAATEAQANADAAAVDDPPALTHATFAHRRCHAPSEPLCNGYTSEVVEAHRALRRLHQADGRRARATALMHFTRLLHTRHAVRSPATYSPRLLATWT